MKGIKIIVVVLIVIGISWGVTRYQTKPPLSTWNSNYILTFHGHSYKVESVHVKSVENILGTVTYHGSPSGTFKLYSIPGVTNFKEIAVQTTDGYLLAIEK